MIFLRKIFFVIFFILIGTLISQAQINLIAKDDSAKLCICEPHVVIIPILENDDYSCENQEVKLINKGVTGLANVAVYGDIMYYEFPYFISEPITDSVKYSISCGDIIDTATVCVNINHELEPWVEFENSWDKNCLKEGEDIVHTCVIRNKCSVESQRFALGLYFSNAGVDASHDEALVDIVGNVRNWNYSNSQNIQIINFTLDAQSEIRFTTKYHIHEILSGKYETEFVLFVGNAFNKYETTYIPVCPDKEITLTSCDDSIYSIDLATNCSSIYNIVEGPFIHNNEAFIDSKGIFRYMPANEIEKIEKDSVKYEAVCADGSSLDGWIRINLLPCMDEPAATYTPNDFCNDDSCKYVGPSILINEVMISPTEYDGAIYGKQCNSSIEEGGEWIELYNPDKCNSVNISGYFFANSTIDQAGTSCLKTRNLGAGFVLPEGTVIPPMGFCVMRGGNASPVDPARLIENGGNTVELIFTEHLDKFCLNNEGYRFWLPNAGGWFAFYNREGVPQDAIYWGDPDEDICPDCYPCNPGFEGTYNGVLCSLDEFPTERKTNILNFSLSATDQQGNSAKRIPDGGDWSLNSLYSPTMGYCNEDCNTRSSESCNGTAIVKVSGGSGNFSFLWDDPEKQTSATATGLCEGTYCVTITDNETLLEEVVCVTVTNNIILCHHMHAVNDTLISDLCRSSDILVNVLTNDTFFCNNPKINILTSPVVSGATISVVRDSFLLYSFPEGNVNITDSILYEISCENYRDTAMFLFHTDRKSPVFTSLEIDKNKVSFSVAGGTQPFSFFLNDTLSVNAPEIFGLPNGEYSLRVTDTNGCEDSVSFDILINTEYYAKNDTLRISTCANVDTFVSVLNNDPIIDYIHCDDPEVTLLTIPVLQNAEITLSENKLYYYLPWSENLVGKIRDSVKYMVSCDTLNREAWMHIFIQWEYPRITDLYLNTNQANINVEGGVLPYLFILDDSIASNLSLFDNLLSGNHKLLVMDKNLCKDSISFEIEQPCKEIIPDDYFSPNGDGIKDVWNIMNLECYRYYVIEIYNRFGKLLQRYENQFIPWDGTYLGVSQSSTDYWYYISIDEIDYTVVGHFTLLR